MDPKAWKAGSWPDTCTPVFITASVTMTKRRRDPRVHPWVNAKWHVAHTHTTECSLAWKRLNEILQHATARKDPPDTVRGETDPAQERMRRERRRQAPAPGRARPRAEPGCGPSGTARGWQVGGGARGFLSSSGDRIAVWENEKVLEVGGGDGYTTLQLCLMPLTCSKY